MPAGATACTVRKTAVFVDFVRRLPETSRIPRESVTGRPNPSAASIIPRASDTMAVASATMAEAAAKRLRRLAEELDESGLQLHAGDALRELLVHEIDHALRPAVHERRVASSGTILEPLSDPATWASGAQLDFVRGPVDQPLA